MAAKSDSLELHRKLMSELVKERPDQRLVKDYARRLGYDPTKDMEELMMKVLRAVTPSRRTTPAEGAEA